MNKILLLITLIIFTNSTSSAQSGKLNVFWHGFICHNQTEDNILGGDGVGDEIYLSRESAINNVSNTVVIPKSSSSKVYGEYNNLMGYNYLLNRKKAGTATINGGIKSGDTFIINEIYPIINNEKINASSVIFISPSIWEYDNYGSYPMPSVSFSKISKSVLGSIFFQNKVRDQLTSLDYNNITNLNFLVPGRYFDLDQQLINVFKSTSRELQSRPIGMNSNFEFNSIVMILNSKLCSMLSTKDFGYGVGVVPVFYSDLTLGNTANHGAYTILLKIEFVPDITTVTQPSIYPPAPAATNKQLTINNTISRTDLFTKEMNNHSLIEGKWAGELQIVNEKVKNSILIDFQSNGSMLVTKDKSFLTGNYVYQNGTIGGNYTSKEGVKYLFKGKVEGNMIHGTLEREGNSNENETLILSKQ